MSAKTNFYVTLLGGWFGLHKFMKGRIGAGFLYLFTCGLFGIGWIIDIITAIPKKTVATMEASPYHSYEKQASIQPLVAKYYKGMEEIESMWSVLYNLRIVSGEQADVFEQKCYQNLADFQTMVHAQRASGLESAIPPHIPAYVRLAMLYEKQERYQEAINICVEAIKLGAVSDGNKGKMYGRLARLIRKSGITVSDDVLKLAATK